MESSDYEQTSTARMVVTFLGGLAVGYGLALLLAPRTGRETRAMLSDYAQSTGETLSGMARSAVDSAKQAAATASQKLSDTMKSTQQRTGAAASAAASELERH
jgi:gas vesicle protein